MNRLRLGMVLGWAAAGALVSVPLAGAAPGDLDDRYGDRGRVVTDLSGDDDVARGIAVGPDGRIVVVGSLPGPLDSDFAVARYLPDGTLDPGFGTGGKVSTDFGGTDEAAAVALAPDGGIIVAGYGGGNGDADIALARYRSDGSLDPGFGEGGKVTTDLGRYEDANALAIQPDGRIVAAGCTRCLQNSSNFALVRYLPDGRPDATFGDGGHVTTDFGKQADEANAVAVLPDGKLVAVGFAAAFEPNGIGPGSRNSNFGVARYLPDGRLDTAFGTDGLTATDFGEGNDSASGMTVQPDGKVVAAGLGFVSGSFKFVLARYDSDGALDPVFGRGGKVVTAFASDPSAIEPDPGDGSTDRGASANAVALDADGMLVAAGVKRGSENDNFALARYTTNGMLDPTFGQGGLVTTDFDQTEDEANALALTADGRVVAAGLSGRDSRHDFALAWYRGGLLVDPAP